MKVKPVEMVLERAEAVRRVGSGWMVSCPLPGHGRGLGDRKPSVSITEGDDSRALVNCQAGCQTEDIVAEWGLSMSDLFENRNVHRGGPILCGSKQIIVSRDYKNSPEECTHAKELLLKKSVSEAARPAPEPDDRDGTRVKGDSASAILPD